MATTDDDRQQKLLNLKVFWAITIPLLIALLVALLLVKLA